MTLTVLYQQFEKKLHRYATRLVHDSHKAEDLVQETFIRAMGHIELLGQLEPHQRQAWLYRVLKNLFIDEQRAQQREQFLMEQLSQQAQLMEQLRLNSHPMLQVLLQDLFDQIPERYRELLHKYYVLGMTNKEIADELGIPAATVRSRLHIALKKLRANKSRFL
jgi:RNA polymerase sigma-70 factor (ECF subfamily)